MLLVAWLKNAFVSDDVPATWIRFRLREWCGRAAEVLSRPVEKTESESPWALKTRTQPSSME